MVCQRLYYLQQPDGALHHYGGIPEEVEEQKVKMIMDKYDIEKLRNLPIEGVAQRLGLRVERHKSLCPFHEDSHPSLSFKVSKNTCRCFVCMTQSIGPIDLVMRHLHMDFKAACRWLANENNIILDEWQPKCTIGSVPLCSLDSCYE